MEYKKHTLSNGAVVLLQPCGVFLGLDIQKNANKRRPLPPVQRVNFGTPEAPDYRDEANTSDPDYLDKLREHEADIEERTARAYFRLGVKIEWTDDKKARLEQIRQVMEEIGDPIQEKDDTIAYLRYVICGDPNVYSELLQAVIGVSQPTEEAVQEHIETFQPEVQGA